MSSPRLPTHLSDAWECSFLFESARPVRSVSARGGLVIAGGDEMYLVRPGAQNMASRPPPLDIGPIVVAAAEPRAPFRYAVASKELVAIFYRANDADQIMRLRPPPGGPSATHLAWGLAHGESRLYVRWDDGGVVRLTQNMEDLEELELPPMDALAADTAGVVAMISFEEPDPRAYVTRDGEQFSYRPLPLDADTDPSQPVHLTVADMAVAYAVEDSGAFVSRAHEEPFVHCEPLANAGPLAFEGTSSDAALIGGAQLPDVAAIIRVDREGAAVRIAEFGSDVGPPEIAALSWDASREKVWVASPEMGLATCTAPSAKHGKKALS